MRAPIIACLFALSLASCRQPRQFSDDFLFGAATAGFQIDPGCPTLPAADCVDTRSDWYQWVTSPEQLEDLKGLITFEPLANAPGYWELYEQDLERARAELGLNAVRVSIEWSRSSPPPQTGSRARRCGRRPTARTSPRTMPSSRR